MATQNSTDVRVGIDHRSPARRLVAAGIKRGNRTWLVEQPEQSAADKAAHAAASYVRTARTAVAS